MKHIVLVAILCVVGSVRLSDAGNLWSVNGASCVPDNGTVTGGRWDSANGIVTFTGSGAASINLYCPITTPIANPTQLLMLHEHTAAGTSMAVGLYSISKSTGALTLVGGAGAVQCGFANQIQACPLNFSPTPTLDFTNNWYFVAVNMNVTGSGDLWFYGATLSN